MIDTLNDDIALDSGGGPLPKPDPFSKQSSYEISPDCELSIEWDKTTEEVILQVIMPSDAYLAIAFGSSLDKCDMILFESKMDDPTTTDCNYEDGIVDYKDWQ